MSDGKLYAIRLADGTLITSCLYHSKYIATADAQTYHKGATVVEVCVVERSFIEAADAVAGILDMAIRLIEDYDKDIETINAAITLESYRAARKMVTP